jgi:predicted secreted protein
MLLAGPAMAGDRALADFIGFSSDGRYFAFEEFGVQDGSGFAYSSIYVLDMKMDNWVIGTPVRAQANDETTTLHEIRTQSETQAQATLEGLDIVVPAEITALIGDGTPGNDGSSLRFGAPGYAAPGDVLGDYELTLTRFTTTSGTACEDLFGAPPMGYELNLTTAGGSTRLLHRDETLPRSRGCPLNYRLYGVVLPQEASSVAIGVAVVSVYPGGFEGPNRRFIAVPLGSDGL